MPNDSGKWPNKREIREGGDLSAMQLNRIVDALARRIVGDNKTIAVRSFQGGQLLIEAMGGRKGASSTTTENKAAKVWWGPYISEAYFPDPRPNPNDSPWINPDAALNPNPDLPLNPPAGSTTVDPAKARNPNPNLPLNPNPDDQKPVIPMQAMIRQGNGEIWVVNPTRTGWTCINRLKKPRT